MQDLHAEPARIDERYGRRWWCCPACGRKLGEIVGRQVVIKMGRHYLVIALANDQLQRCPSPSCGAESVVRADRIA